MAARRALDHTGAAIEQLLRRFLAGGPAGR